MKGLKLRNIVGIFCLVLCGAGVLVAHVWKQNDYVRLSMAAVKLGKERSRLRNDIALLEISVGGLKKRSRIEALAKERFGLVYGNAPVPVYAENGSGDGSAEDPAVSGRTASVNGSGAARSADGAGLESGEVAWRIRGL